MAYLRQGSRSEHLDCVSSTGVAFCALWFVLHVFLRMFFWVNFLWNVSSILQNLASLRFWGCILHMYSRGFCTCMLLAQSGRTILLQFSQLFRGGCRAKCVLHVFSRVFLMLARQMVVRLHFARVLSSISARVSVEQPKFAFS